MSTPLFPRRGALIAGATFLAIPSRAVRAGPDTTLLLDAVRGLFEDPGSSAALGRTWLADAPANEADSAFLAAALGPASSTARLLARMRSDFAAGRIVRLEGWVLSLTEARACALLALAGHG